MPRRLYLCDPVYDPVKDRRYPAIEDYTANGYRVIAERFQPRRTSTGLMLVVAKDITLAEHQAAIADVRVTHIPLERIDGQLADDADTIGDLTAAQRTTIRNRLEALGIDLSDIALSWTIRQFLAAVVRRLVILQEQDAP